MNTELTAEKSLQVSSAAKEPLAGQPAPDRRVVLSEKFPKVLGPYSHAVVAGGFVFESCKRRKGEHSSSEPG